MLNVEGSLLSVQIEIYYPAHTLLTVLLSMLQRIQLFQEPIDIHCIINAEFTDPCSS